MTASDVPGAVLIDAPDWQTDAERAQAEVARLRAQVAELETLKHRADEVSGWCGDALLHRAVRYIRTGTTGDLRGMAS